MSTEIFWRLPLHGDGRSLSAEAWNRGDYSPHRKEPHPYARTGVQRDGYTYFDHLSQIARAADLTRFDGVWIPYSPAGEEPLIVAGGLAREARRVTFVAALRAPLNSAVYTAKIAVSFQRLSGGRLAWFLLAEEDPESPWHGQRWSVSEQIARTSEFLDVAKGFWNQAPFTYEGRYYEVLNGGFPPALQGSRLPRIYLSGQSDEALALSARHADVHILPLAPIDEVRRSISHLSGLAAAQGRTVQFGIEADVLARHSNAEAWADIGRRWDHAKSTGPATGLIGSYEEVAEQIVEYIRAGVSTFVLSANPHLEEAYLVGERVLPLVRLAAREPLERAA